MKRSLLESLVGPDYMPDIQGGILFVEDTHEPSRYFIDRRSRHYE